MWPHPPRPSNAQLWADLGELHRRIKPDFDPTTREARAGGLGGGAGGAGAGVRTPVRWAHGDPLSDAVRRRIAEAKKRLANPRATLSRDRRLASAAAYFFKLSLRHPGPSKRR